MSPMLSRRLFLKSGAIAAVGYSLLPRFLGRALAAVPESGRWGKTLVTIFQRGAADGLSMVPPYAEPGYRLLRPSLAIAPPGSEEGVIDLDGHFGLHPALAPLKPLWDAGTLAVVHAVGLPGATRSHFDAQDFLDTGTPGRKGTPDGWLNRALESTSTSNSGAAAQRSIRPFRAVALQPALPRSLTGSAPALAIDSLESFRLGGVGGRFARAAVATRMDTFESLYASAVDDALRITGAEAFDALRSVDEAKLAELPPQNGAEYPRGPLGKRLQDIARLIRADVGLEIAVTDCLGWDTHVQQGAAEGQLANRLEELGKALAAFATDLGDRMSDVCVVTMTEFGRTARENGNHGTDHGSASALFAFGGSVKGKRVAGAWRPLRDEYLFEGRDLAVQTDIRGVLLEALAGHLSIPSAPEIFPGFAADGAHRTGLFG